MNKRLFRKLFLWWYLNQLVWKDWIITEKKFYNKSKKILKNKIVTCRWISHFMNKVIKKWKKMKRSI